MPTMTWPTGAKRSTGTRIASTALAGAIRRVRASRSPRPVRPVADVDPRPVVFSSRLPAQAAAGSASGRALAGRPGRG